MLESFIKILKFAMKHWFGMFLSVIGAAIGSWLLLLYRTHLKDWLLSTRYVEMPGWAWVLIALGISTVPALLVFLIMCWKTQRRKRVLTDETDIKNVLKQWFQQRYCEDWGDPISQDTVNFSILDRKLGLLPGSAKRYLDDVVSKFFHWRTLNEGQDTVEIRRK
jgi:hypothetical protein